MRKILTLVLALAVVFASNMDSQHHWAVRQVPPTATATDGSWALPRNWYPAAG